MRLISIMFSTFIALSIMAGCIEEKNDQTEVYFDVANLTEDDAPLSTERQSLSTKQNRASDEDIKKHKTSSRNKKKQASYSSEKPRSSWSEYRVIIENNLFRPIGWQKVVKRITPKTETVAVEIPPERPEPTYTLTLTGIAQNGSEWIAILEDRTKKEGYFLHHGEKLKDSLVSEILSEHIILVQGDSKAQFPLGASIQYNTNGQLLLNTIANQSILIPNSEFRISNSGEDAPQSLIERMKARRRKELGKE